MKGVEWGDNTFIKRGIQVLFNQRVASRKHKNRVNEITPILNYNRTVSCYFYDSHLDSFIGHKIVRIYQARAEHPLMVVCCTVMCLFFLSSKTSLFSSCFYSGKRKLCRCDNDIPNWVNNCHGSRMVISELRMSLLSNGNVIHTVLRSSAIFNQ